MASVRSMQEETMASLDTAKAIVDKVAPMMGLIVSSPSLSQTFATNPIGFLMQLLKRSGISYEDIRLWLVKFLINTIPSLEIGVKTVLLTNLKKMISCSIDPRIPEKYRKRHKAPANYNTSQEYGIDINIESIDIMDKLSVNPLNEFGNEMYFGLEGVTDSYKFARADDMDAFLWFVIHKGKFPNSAKISSISNLAESNNVHGSSPTQVLPSDGTLLAPLEVTYSKDNPSSILLGNTFAYDNGHVISMCIDRKLDDVDNIVHNTLVPVSDDWSSVNWYIRRADQLGKNLGFGWGVNEDNANTYYKGKSRDFSKERGICNIQYIDQASSDSPLIGLVNNKFRFTILPKPLIHVPDISNGEPPWRFKKMLFNYKGEYDPNGKYTLVNQVDSTSKTYLGGVVSIDYKSGEVTVTDKDTVVKNLIECYPGLTVYEFNYDYVMGMKLFDAKVMATALMDSLINTSVGININSNKRHQEMTEMVREIIRNIAESDDSNVSDCYYTFDNSKYETLLRRAEEKRARRERFGNVTHEIGNFNSVREILDEYDANSELHKQEEVIHRAIRQAAIIVSEGVDEVDRNDVEFNFVCDLIENLVTAIVNGILSPKLLMLLEVNQTIMGGTWEKFTMKDLLKAMESIIVSIVKEVRDLVVQELKSLVLKQLEPIIETLGSILVREQLDDYSDAIMDIIRNCTTLFSLGGFQYEDTELDNVDYADIDANQQPTTNEC